MNFGLRAGRSRREASRRDSNEVQGSVRPGLRVLRGAPCDHFVGRAFVLRQGWPTVSRPSLARRAFAKVAADLTMRVAESLHFDPRTTCATGPGFRPPVGKFRNALPKGGRIPADRLQPSLPGTAMTFALGAAAGRTAAGLSFVDVVLALPLLRPLVFDRFRVRRSVSAEMRVMAPNLDHVRPASCRRPLNSVVPGACRERSRPSRCRASVDRPASDGVKSEPGSISRRCLPRGRSRRRSRSRHGVMKMSARKAVWLESGGRPDLLSVPGLPCVRQTASVPVARTVRRRLEVSCVLVQSPEAQCPDFHLPRRLPAGCAACARRERIAPFWVSPAFRRRTGIVADHACRPGARRR